MNFRNFIYLIRLGLKNVWNNKVYAAAAVMSMAACIFLFGIFYIAMVNINSAVRNVEKDVAVSVFFEEGISEERVEELGEEIRGREEVTNTVYISEDEAWDSFREDFLDSEELREGIFEGDNPLAGCDSYEVYINDISRQEEFVAYVKSLEGVGMVTHSSEVVNALIRLKERITGIGAGCLFVLILLSVLLIRSTLLVTVASQKDKVRVMRLIGAREDFIRIPFIVEGLVLGIAGMCIPIALLYATYVYGIRFVDVHFGLFGAPLKLLPAGQVMPELIQASVALGVLTGIIGSIAVMGRLKSK